MTTLTDRSNDSVSAPSSSDSLIFSKNSKNSYLFETKYAINPATITKESPIRNIAIPIVADTEYAKNQRKGITAQCRAIFAECGEIFAHPDLPELAREIGYTKEDIRHPIFKSEFVLIDYLQSLGLNIRIKKWHRQGRREKTKGKNSKGFQQTNKNQIVQNEAIKSRKSKNGDLVLSKCEFIIYCHFALAELLMIFTGEFKDEIKTIIDSKNDSQRIEMNRRLRTVTYHDGKPVSESIRVNWLTYINNKPHETYIRFVDTIGLHGNAGYKDLCQSVGIKLEHKDDLSQDDKENMHIVYFEKPKVYDNYSLGDLEVYNILKRNADLFKQIYESLGMADEYEEPKLTIGSTIATLFRKALLKYFKKHSLSPKAQEALLKIFDTNHFSKELDKKIINLLSHKGTAIYYKELVNSTAALNAKVFGGRCRNNRPTTSQIIGIIVDLDIAGAYGEGQRNQIYPIGNPICEFFDPESKINHYKSLREFLKLRKWGKKNCELVPGLWYAIVSNKCHYINDKKVYDTLQYPQDFLSSWFNFRIKDIKDIKTDTEKFDLEKPEIDPKSGTVKILNKQVVNGIITHEFIDWLYNTCSPRQRDDLLDNLYIQTALYYPAYSQCQTIEDFLDKVANHKGKNTSISRKRREVNSGEQTNQIQEHTYWYGLDLGKFIIDDLLAWRKIYSKKNKDKTKKQLNTLYKLCVNTLYGVFTSPFFDIGNVVVGNNITARCRALCWYMEKGLYGVESITDGCAFDIRKIVQKLKNRKVTNNSVTNLYQSKNPYKNHIKLAPLGGAKEIDIYWYNHHTWDEIKKELKTEKKPVLILDGTKYLDNPQKWIDLVCMEHLRDIFPKTAVLHKTTEKLTVKKGIDGNPIKSYIPRIGQFEFESKAIYTEGFFHGSANYLLLNPSSKNIAMRSYEKKKKHETISEVNNVLTITRYYENKNPGETFLSALKTPEAIPRGKVFRKTGILKIKQYQANKIRWQDRGYEPGDTIYKPGLLREFSISQFTFQTMDQYIAIEKELNRNKRRYDQSYEGYFVNQDGTLNFREMIETLDAIISSGEVSINSMLDQSRNRNRVKDIVNHPEKDVYLHIKKNLFNLQIDEKDLKRSILIDETSRVHVIEQITQEEINTIYDSVDFDGIIEDDWLGNNSEEY